MYKDDLEFWTGIIQSIKIYLGAANDMYILHEHYIKTLCEKATLGDGWGYRTIDLNVNYPFISDCGGELLKITPNADIAVLYSHTENTLSVSLRSRTDGPDVAAIAKKYGGGGHEHAAGFKITGEHLNIDTWIVS